MEISERTCTGGGVSFLTQVVLAATSLVWLSGAVAEAQTFNVLYNFAGNGSNGAPYQPYNGLAMTSWRNSLWHNLEGRELRGRYRLPVEARRSGLAAERLV